MSRVLARTWLSLKHRFYPATELPVQVCSHLGAAPGPCWCRCGGGREIGPAGAPAGTPGDGSCPHRGACLARCRRQTRDVVGSTAAGGPSRASPACRWPGGSACTSASRACRARGPGGRESGVPCRWVWELLQNAVDSAERRQNSLSVALELQLQALIYTHDGGASLDEEIACLGNIAPSVKTPGVAAMEENSDGNGPTF